MKNDHDAKVNIMYEDIMSACLIADELAAGGDQKVALIGAVLKIAGYGPVSQDPEKFMTDLAHAIMPFAERMDKENNERTA